MARSFIVFIDEGLYTGGVKTVGVRVKVRYGWLYDIWGVCRITDPCPLPYPYPYPTPTLTLPLPLIFGVYVEYLIRIVRDT